MKIQYTKLREDVRLPEYAHYGDAGADVFLPEDVVIEPGDNRIPLGFKAVLPDGVCALITPRSSWMGRIQNAAVPVDPGYSGEWHFCFHNNTGRPIVCKKGDRICQIMLLPFIQAEWVAAEDYRNNSRGEGGLGSTGK